MPFGWHTKTYVMLTWIRLASNDEIKITFTEHERFFVLSQQNRRSRRRSGICSLAMSSSSSSSPDKTTENADARHSLFRDEYKYCFFFVWPDLLLAINKTHLQGSNETVVGLTVGLRVDATALRAIDVWYFGKMRIGNWSPRVFALNKNINFILHLFPLLLHRITSHTTFRIRNEKKKQ